MISYGPTNKQLDKNSKQKAWYKPYEKQAPSYIFVGRKTPTLTLPRMQVQK